MKTLRLLWLAVMMVAVGCSNGTGPAGIDPTILITNNTDWSVHFEWRDGQGVAGADTIPGHVGRCERFFARPDSAYFYADVTDPTGGGSKTSTVTAPWFDPDARHAWTMVVTPGGPNSSPGMLLRDSTSGAVAC